ncbi:hypothetical protein [Alcanivorax sp. S71-1-4]|uniref:hypothetical protein n=1 Tax=Alcanivorax sp. S71-1-4 TaxID=1177159 RepID=UPI00135B6EB3|nr:hypothetical protein [Alcanivorax sp. S71-1-4]
MALSLLSTFLLMPFRYQILGRAGELAWRLLSLHWPLQRSLDLAGEEELQEMKKKPDALVLLAVIFGLGVLVSSLTYGGNEARLDQMAASAGVKTVDVNR